MYINNHINELKTVAVAVHCALQGYFQNEEIVEDPVIEAFQQLRDCNDRPTLETANTLLKALEEIHDFKYIRDYLYEDIEETLALCDKDEIEDYELYSSVLFGVNDAELLQVWKDLQPYDMNEGCWCQHWFV